jgi:MFS family permease
MLLSFFYISQLIFILLKLIREKNNNVVGGISMKRDPKTMNSVILLITILSVGLQDIAAGAVSPAIAAICAAYPDVPTSTIQLIVTLPTLSICVMAPIYGWLSNRVQPRKLIITGLFLFCLGGSLPVLLNSLPLIVICRLALGVGTGITCPAALSIIPVFYEGKKRDKLIGLNQSLGSVGCILMQSIGGYFADINWHLSFLAYLVGLFSLVLVIFYLPDIPMKKVAADIERSKNISIFKSVRPNVYGLAIVVFFAMLFICIPTTNLSLFIEGSGIGTAASTGVILSIYTVGITIGSVAFGYLKKALHIYVIPAAYFLDAIGFIGVSMSHDLVLMGIMITIAGLGTGLCLCGYLGRAAEITELPYVAFAISLVVSGNGIGNFIHPTVVGLLDNLFGNIYGCGAILIAGLSLLVMGVIILAVYLATANRRIGEKILQ